MKKLFFVAALALSACNVSPSQAPEPPEPPKNTLPKSENMMSVEEKEKMAWDRIVTDFERNPNDWEPLDTIIGDARYTHPKLGAIILWDGIVYYSNVKSDLRLDPSETLYERFRTAVDKRDDSLFGKNNRALDDFLAK